MPTPRSSSDVDDHALDATLRGLHEKQRVFGRYELVRQLGQGGMGVVWLARDHKLDLDIALKFLREKYVHDETAMDELRHETRRCMRLHHPNIVRVYDLAGGGGNEAAAIAMEYVAGRSLAELRLVQTSLVFEWSEVAPWLLQVCAALAHAHTEGCVVHRDLKPANLMLDARGRLRVMDFGIAASLSETLSRRDKSGSMLVIKGTLPYMSPQQLIGAPPRVTDDVYALGATLYELLTGTPPFYRDNVLQQIEMVAPIPMSQRRRELRIASSTVIPPLWEQTVAACLAKKPEHRPSSVMAVWDILSQTPCPPPSAKEPTAPAKEPPPRPKLDVVRPVAPPPVVPPKPVQATTQVAAPDPFEQLFERLYTKTAEDLPVQESADDFESLLSKFAPRLSRSEQDTPPKK